MISVYGTFGPACCARETLEQMFRAGMTGMRLNLSHTSLEESDGWVTAFHEAAEAAGVQPELLIDMQGPELRIGVLPEALLLAEGDVVVLGEGGIPVPDQTLPVMLAGDEVLLDDGKISVRICENHGGYVKQPPPLRGAPCKGAREVFCRGRINAARYGSIISCSCSGSGPGR